MVQQSKTNFSCWVITDGAAGNERQALALARALKVSPKILRLKLRAPWSWLAPRAMMGDRLALPQELRDSFTPPWPELAIGCGRQAAWLTRMLRKWSNNRTFTIQILDPRISTTYFDLVITPQHDNLRGDNVITTLGSLNAVDDDWLAEGYKKFHTFTQFPRPRTTVLIGGSHRSQKLDSAYFTALINELTDIYNRDGGSFLVSISRRTPSNVTSFLREVFSQWPGYFYDGSGEKENPYPGFLAYADRLVVTPDSVNMLSEACATGKPVWTYTPQSMRGKLAQFHTSLKEKGLLQSLPFTEVSWSSIPLRETYSIAEKIGSYFSSRH